MPRRYTSFWSLPSGEVRNSMAENISRVQTHISGLDDKLSGGIPEGYNIVIWGSVGTLKTSIAYNIAYKAAQAGRNTIYFSLEQVSSVLCQQMTMMGMDIKNVEDHMTVVDIGALRRATHILEADEPMDIDWGKVVLNHVMALRESKKIDLCVIDSLNVFSMFTPKEKKRSILFHTFRKMKESGMTALFIVEDDDKSGNGNSGVARFLADGSINTSVEVKGRTTTRLLQVEKLRSTAHSTDFYPLLFDKDQFKILTK